MDELGGGWLAVVMEIVDGVTPGLDEFQACKKFLEEVLQKLADKNYVHGNLRLPNIMKHDSIHGIGL